MPEPMIIAFITRSYPLKVKPGYDALVAAFRASSFCKRAAWLLRVIGYQIKNGRLIMRTTAGTTAKNKRIPNNACSVCATFGT